MSPIMSFYLGRLLVYGLSLIKFQRSVKEENREEKEQIKHSEEETNRAGLIVIYRQVLTMIAGVSIPAPVRDHHRE